MPNAPTPKAPAVSFANLICRFGDKFVLLDLAREVVLPAFTDQSLKRRYRDTTYFFFETKISEIPGSDGTNVPLIIVHGKLVKDTVLTREQVFSQDRGLVPAQESMPSAPSSFFVLVLNNHKLIYMAETPHAPMLGQFQTALQRFLSIRYEAYVDALYSEAKSSPEPKPKKQIRLEIPHPTVEVLPLASKASIEEFLRAFAKVTHLEFKIIETNQEYPMERTYQELRKMKKSIRATSTRLVHDSAFGLDKANAIEQIHAAAASGNEKVSLTGTSEDGVRLSGDNHRFKLSVHPEGLPENELDRAAHLVKLYADRVESGIILEDVAADTSDKIQRLSGHLHDE